MKWHLFDYQVDAVAHVLEQMAKARRRYHDEGEISSFALTATTGAGKTVIASAVIEALFRGSSDFGVDADSSAVVLWITDDASLNNQTLHNMIKASDLDVAQLHTIENEDFPRVLAPLHLYFLNIQKLYDSSTRYTEPTDLRTYSLWDALRNTIENEDLTLYVVIDEAHKGMKHNEGRATTIKRVVNGAGSVPAAPIVWGISATTERFTTAMKAARGRTTLPDAEVPIAEVQASGLLKDAILLDNPNEAGQFDTTMLRDAVRQLGKQSERWRDYCATQDLAPVLPLLVVQVENKPAQAELERIVSVIVEEWPDLPPEAIANVFGEHETLQLGGRRVRYAPPESVEDDLAIRILLAKDAVTTGWDCPRAEVLYSMRGAQDRTYITQFIGRMVRTPLARRITSDENLNAVVCLLPKFRRATTIEIARKLSNAEYDNGGNGPERQTGAARGIKVYRQPVDLTRNLHLDQAVFDLIATLPSEPKPNPLAKPIPRMFRMAAALAGDNLLRNAHELAIGRICRALDGLMAEHESAVATLKDEIQTAEIATIRVELGKGEISESVRSLAADIRTVDDAFVSASRPLTKAVANAYQLHRARGTAGGGNLELFEAKLEVAALGLLPVTAPTIAAYANTMVNDWLVEYDTAIKHLSDDRHAEYDQIRMQSATPIQRETRIPQTRLDETVDKDWALYPTRPLNLLCDQAGEFPIGSLNNWERQVLDVELGRGTCVAWYRNPQSATESAIQVPYRVNEKWSTVQPDFIFFSRKGDGELCASIVDPHGDYLADAVDKLNGLAQFAERHQGQYLRIESLAKNGAGQMVRLDLTRPAVREAVAVAERASALFNGPLAIKFA